ncbi:unnamed protein product [Bursaphelenchus okinawaensis]|uniref:Protein kinase domain-containing protein n=1 Tax=Bursaphelenchus okinawaensis TaxID=465554 RepID=A0A811K194_9BILA|nr:unnamed protein product [Bursaphelenchus okinawaensis]CAG9089784.1 unnamed protein product [Bursaphelenchus okinawaensis]
MAAASDIGVEFIGPSRPTAKRKDLPQYREDFQVFNGIPNYPVDYLFDGKFRIKSRISWDDRFGATYIAAPKKPYHPHVVLRIDNLRKHNPSSLITELEVLSLAKDKGKINYFGEFLQEGCCNGENFWYTKSFKAGPSLRQITECMGAKYGRLSSATVGKFALDLFEIVNFLHTSNYLICAIDQDLFRLDTESGTLFLAGLSTMKHMNDNNITWTGSLDYSPLGWSEHNPDPVLRECYSNLELEAVFYLIAHLVSGELPWIKDGTMMVYQKKMNNVHKGAKTWENLPHVYHKLWTEIIKIVRSDEQYNDISSILDYCKQISCSKDECNKYEGMDNKPMNEELRELLEYIDVDGDASSITNASMRDNNMDTAATEPAQTSMKQEAEDVNVVQDVEVVGNGNIDRITIGNDSSNGDTIRNDNINRLTARNGNIDRKAMRNCNMNGSTVRSGKISKSKIKNGISNESRIRNGSSRKSLIRNDNLNTHTIGDGSSNESTIRNGNVDYTAIESAQTSMKQEVEDVNVVQAVEVVRSGDITGSTIKNGNNDGGTIAKNSNSNGNTIINGNIDGGTIVNGSTNDVEVVDLVSEDGFKYCMNNSSSEGSTIVNDDNSRRPSRNCNQIQTYMPQFNFIDVPDSQVQNRSNAILGSKSASSAGVSSKSSTKGKPKRRSLNDRKSMFDGAPFHPVLGTLVPSGGKHFNIEHAGHHYFYVSSTKRGMNTYICNKCRRISGDTKKKAKLGAVQTNETKVPVQLLGSHNHRCIDPPSAH